MWFKKKIKESLNFFKKILNIYQQLIRPLQSNTPQIKFTYASIFINPRNTSVMRFLVSSIAPVFSSIAAKRLFFVGVFSIRKIIGGGQVQWYGPKTPAQAMMYEHNQNTWLVFPQFSAFLTNCFGESAHKIVFLIDHMTFWLELMRHHAIAIVETSEQNLYTYQTWCNFLALAFLDNSIEMIRLWFQCHSHTPMIPHQLRCFSGNLREVHATLFLLII